jgi:hypothetical protein
MGSIAEDKKGDIALGFQRLRSERLPLDPLQPDAWRATRSAC